MSRTRPRVKAKGERCLHRAAINAVASCFLRDFILTTRCYDDDELHRQFRPIHRKRSVYEMKRPLTMCGDRSCLCRGYPRVIKDCSR